MHWKCSTILAALYFVIAQDGYVEGAAQFLRFVKIPTEPKSSTKIIDASVPQMLVLPLFTKPVFAFLVTFKIVGLVEKLDPDYSILSAQICFTDNPASQGICKVVNDMGVASFPAGNSAIEVGYELNPLEKLEMELKVRLDDIGRTQVDYSGFYYLKLQNKKNTLTSPFVQVLDYYFYSTQYTKYKALPSNELVMTVEDLNRSKLPLNLECGTMATTTVIKHPPVSMQPFVRPPVEWFFCTPPVATKAEGTTLEQCTVLGSRRSLWSVFNGKITYNGGITLFGVVDQGVLSKGFIFCLPRTAAPSVVYASQTKGPVVYDTSQDFNAQYIARSPTSKDITVVAKKFDIKDPRFYIEALYTSPKNPTFVWEHEGRGSIDTHLASSAYRLEFGNEITKSDGGVYKLRVGGNQLTFTFRVNVVEPPAVKDHMPSLVYIMSGNDLSLAVNFTGDEVKSQMFINGASVNFGQPDPFSAVKANGAMQGVDMEVRPPLPTNKITYTAKNLQNNNKIGDQTQSLTFGGLSKYGAFQINSLVKVLKIPMLKYPIRNCTTGCTHNLAHTFYCDLGTQNYIHPELEVYQTWILNNEDLRDTSNDLFKKYIKMSNDYRNLTIGPVFTGDSEDKEMQKAMENGVLVCSLRLVNLAAPSASSYRDVYNSEKDVAIRNSLRSHILMTVDAGAKLPTSANFSWIAAVVVALLLILIVAILAAWMILRNKGETYDVDEKEREQGNDPEREIRDKEAFHTYERAEEQPVRGSRFSLNDDSVGVGSDDEGELEEYDLDPGKFNEEGSFIGQYASDPRKKPTLPAHTAETRA